MALLGWIGLLLLAVSTPGKVEVSVVDSLSNQPVAGARVELQLLDHGVPPVIVHATSNEYGKASFPRVEPGEYRVVLVQAKGYLYERSAYFTPAPINVVEGGVAHGSVKLIPLGTVQGTVTDPDGKALAGATVMVLRYTYANGFKTLLSPGHATPATTDARGKYRIGDVPPGRYYVRLSSRSLAPVYYPNGDAPGHAMRIEVSPLSGMTVADFRVRSTNTFHLRGRVFGIPENARVRLVTIQSCTPGVWELSAFIDSVNISADGSFDAAGVPPGSYCLDFTARNGAEILSESDDAFAVTDRDVDDIKLMAEPLRDISGRITLEDGLSLPWPDSILLLPPTMSGTRPMPGKVGTDGTFRVVGVGPEAYKLVVPLIPIGGYLKSIKLGEREVSDGDINPTGGGALVILIGAARGHLSGRVDFATEGIPVTLAPADPLSNRVDLIRTVYTNSKGEFEANGLVPGAWRIFPWQKFEPELVRSTEFLSQFAATSVEVSEAGSARVEVKMISSAEIELAIRAQ